MKKLLLFIGMALLYGSMLIGQTKNATDDYGIIPNNPAMASANLDSLQNAFNDHVAGDFNKLQFNNGTFYINGTVEINGWDGLQIIGSGNTTIRTNALKPIFKSTINNGTVQNGRIENLKLESTAASPQPLTELEWVNNAGLFQLGNTAFTNFVFDNVEFTAPNADVNGIYIGNGWGSTYITQDISITSCHFRGLGRMGMEFFNTPNGSSDLTPRFENISVMSNNFEDLGRVFGWDDAYNGIGISFGGWGRNHNVANNTFGLSIGTTNIESAGVDGLTIANNEHLGSNGSMYQFNTYLSKNITITNDEAFDYHDGATLMGYVNNLTIESSTLYGGINFGNNATVDALGNPVPPSDVSDIWIRNTIIINDESKNEPEIGIYGAVAFYGQPGTVNNINFEDSYLGELVLGRPLPIQPPVVVTYGFNITNISFTNTCLFHFGNKYTVKQGSTVDVGIDIENYNSDCADVFFPPTVNDEIVSVDTPTSVVRGTTAIVSIEYSAIEARDITVDFRLMSAPYTNYASEVVSVNAGSGTVDVEIDIPSDVPVANSAYRYRIFLLPQGQTGWGNSLGSAYPSNISVIDGAPPTGDLINVTVSKNVVRGTTENLSIDYSVSHTSDISVEFKLMGSPYTTYSSNVVTVNPGSGNEQVSIDIPANVPVANKAYRYRIFLLPTGQTGWGNSLDSAYPGKISVTAQGTNLKASLDFQSIASSNELETLSVYPNPAINATTVHIPFEESYSSYALYSMSGAMVKDGGIDSNQKELPITFSDVEKGMYILRLTNSKGEEAFKKIIKE